MVGFIHFCIQMGSPLKG